MKTYLSSLVVVAFALLSFNASATVRYVDLNCTNATPPYTGWSTAATNIQDAVDAATNGDLVLVTNGVYQTGGAGTGAFSIESNRVAVTKPVTLQSVNGAAVTIIQAYQMPTNSGLNSLRCVWLTNGATLSGFTLMNGYAFSRLELNGGSGGGVYCLSNATVSDCVIISNSAGSGGGAYGGSLIHCFLSQNSARLNGGGAVSSFIDNCTITCNSAEAGGGACVISSQIPKDPQGSWINNCVIAGNVASNGGGVSGCTLNNCILSGNVATNIGGGAYLGVLNNCTVVGNSASSGGGVGGSEDVQYFPKPPVVAVIANNCIVYNNFASSCSNYFNAVFYNGCTTPLPTNGTGNITNEPAFVDFVNGDFHLKSNSACINSGNNSYVTNLADLDGNPRISGGTVDIGAYEFQNPSSVISYAWLQQYGLLTDGSADYVDSDVPAGDGLNNYQEWMAGTNPTNAASVLKMTSAVPTNNLAGMVVTWQSVTNRTYFLQRSVNLAAQPAFSTIQNNIVGHTNTTSYLDTTATNSSQYFYRIGVQ